MGKGKGNVRNGKGKGKGKQEQEQQASTEQQPTYIVELTEAWGGKSWLVQSDVPRYTNKRPPHVEVGDAGSGSHKKGQRYRLTDLQERKGAYMWIVDGLRNGDYPAHFTVAYGAHKGDIQSYA